jgi:hypothetical protein
MPKVKMIVCDCDDLENPFFLVDQLIPLGKLVQLLRAAEDHIRHCNKCCEKYGNLTILRKLQQEKEHDR